MSEANGYATAPTQRAQSPEMDVSRGEQSLQDKDSNIRSTDEGSIASKGSGSQRHRNKQNLDYLWRSGLAGGLAGCAVCTTTLTLLPFMVTILTSCLGQNSSRTSGPCQDPLSGIQPPIRQIHRLMVWRCHSHAGHQPSRWHAWAVSGTLCDPSPYLPLCSDQVPRLRTSALYSHRLPRAGNPITPPAVWIACRHYVRLRDISSGGHTCTAGFRDEERFSLLAIEHLPPNLPRTAPRRALRT